MKIIIITVIIIAVVILGGRWYLHWLKKCYDRKQKQCREQETFIFDKLNQGENLSKTYDRLRNSAKKTIIVLVACILVLGCGAYFVDASYKQWSADFKQWSADFKQWSADFKQWKVERAERKALAEFQKQKEKRLEAERKAEEARKRQERRLEAERKAEEARKRQEAEKLRAEKLRAEQFQKLQNQNIVQKKAEQRKKNIFIAKVNFCLLIFAIFLFFSFFLCILYCAGSKK